MRRHPPTGRRTGRSGSGEANSEDPTGRVLQLIRSATPATARRRTALAAVARPAAEVAGLLLVEVLGNSRARAAALGLARSLARWLARRRLPASAGVEVTARRVTVVKDTDASVLVHRVETALVVRTRWWPRAWPANDENAGQQRWTPTNPAPVSPSSGCSSMLGCPGWWRTLAALTMVVRQRFTFRFATRRSSLSLAAGVRSWPALTDTSETMEGGTST
jgi:hypothetical protein